MIPLGGIAGWRFLQRTQATQQAAFEKGPELQKDIAYFTEKIGAITSAADLVADRRLLKVALGAFGMDSEIDKKAFIRKVLVEGTTDPKALASRLTDKSYARLSDAFGFGEAGGPNTADAGFATTITAAYKTHAFEVAVGDADNNMRLAMNFRREVAALAARGEDGASWYNILGSKPLRQVFEKAFGLPASSPGSTSTASATSSPTRRAPSSARARWPPSAIPPRSRRCSTASSPAPRSRPARAATAPPRWRSRSCRTVPPPARTASSASSPRRADGEAASACRDPRLRPSAVSRGTPASSAPLPPRG